MLNSVVSRACTTLACVRVHTGLRGVVGGCRTHSAKLAACKEVKTLQPVQYCRQRNTAPAPSHSYPVNTLLTFNYSHYRCCKTLSR